MSHINKVIDADPHFVIDINTRNIKNVSQTKTSLVQYDHNSERFSFTLPRLIEGHDMMECNSVQVHYFSSVNPETKGVYAITDLAICEDDAEMVCCTWLISQNVTQTAGAIKFMLRFACVADDGTVEYAWHTNPFTGISITAGMNNAEAVVEQYADILEQWKVALFSLTEEGIRNINTAKAAAIAEIEAAGDLGNLKDCKETNITKYITNWTVGRTENGNHTNSSNHAYSEAIKNEGQAINFDNTKYKIMFLKCDVDGNVGGYQSWKTETPQIPPAYEYFRVQVNVLTSGTLDADYLANSVYYETKDTCELVRKVLESEKKIKKLENSCCYVDGINGADTNDGTVDSPFKTIQKGINANTEIVYIAPGEYCEAVKVQNRDNIAIMPTTYSATFVSGVEDTPKIHIDCAGDETITTSAFSVVDCGNVEVVGVWVDNTKSNGFFLNRTKNVKFVDCIASNTSGEGSCGFKIQSTNGTFHGCKAYGIVLDGFNIHGYGRTEFFNCIAHDCGDDGISHHDGCTGSVIGGEYYNCGKGGIATPTYGAFVDVHNVYSHNNVYGLYVSTDTSKRNASGSVSNSVFKNNTTKDIYINRSDVVAWHNIYDTKEITTTATLTEYE